MITCDTPNVPQGPADGGRDSRFVAHITGFLLGPCHPSRLQAAMLFPAAGSRDGAETTQWSVTGLSSIPGELPTNQE